MLVCLGWGVCVCVCVCERACVCVSVRVCVCVCVCVCSAGLAGRHNNTDSKGVDPVFPATSLVDVACLQQPDLLSFSLLYLPALMVMRQGLSESPADPIRTRKDYTMHSAGGVKLID